MSLLQLTEYKDSRIFIIGGIEGDFYKLIDFLFTQEFSYKDLMILTGNFLNVNELNSEKTLQLIKESPNIFSIKGFNEKILIDQINNNEDIHTKFNITQDDFLFLENLPLIIELNNSIFVINSGYNPKLSLTQQSPELITYKNNLLNKDDWFNYEQQGSIFCFTHDTLADIKVPGGYNLGSSKKELSCLILYKDVEPILITV